MPELIFSHLKLEGFASLEMGGILMAIMVENTVEDFNLVELVQRELVHLGRVGLIGRSIHFEWPFPLQGDGFSISIVRVSVLVFFLVRSLVPRFCRRLLNLLGSQLASHWLCVLCAFPVLRAPVLWIDRLHVFFKQELFVFFCRRWWQLRDVGL